MKWQLTENTETRRVYSKTFQGLHVEKIEVFGLHYASAFGKNAMGAYARPRWATHGFRVNGKFCKRWRSVKEMANLEPRMEVRF